MKRLLLILVLNFGIRIASSDNKYPYIKHYFPQNSQLLQQCEKDATGMSKNQEITPACARLNNAHPTIRAVVAQSLSSRKPFMSPVDYLLAQRIQARHLLNQPDTRNSMRRDIKIILSSLHLSEWDIKREEEIAKVALMIAAESE